MRKLISARLAKRDKTFCIAQEQCLLQSGKEIKKRRMKRNGRLKFYGNASDYTISGGGSFVLRNFVAFSWLSHECGIVRIDILILWMYLVTLTSQENNNMPVDTMKCQKMLAMPAGQFPSAIKVSLIIFSC